MARPELIFDFDIGSPYSYLGAELLPRFTAGFDVQVTWRPVLIGGVFKASGNGMPAAVAAKAAYMHRELSELAELHRIPFRFSSHFPPNTLTVMRTLCAIEDPARVPVAARALFRVYWAEDQNISEPEVIAETLDDAGFAGRELLGRASDPEVKGRLRANTEASVAAGVFGLPAFHLGDRWWWGHDRLLLVARALKAAGAHAGA